MLGYAEKFGGTILAARNQYLKTMTRQNFDVSGPIRSLVSILVGFLCDGNIYCFFPFILSASSYLLMGSTVVCRRVTPGISWRMIGSQFHCKICRIIYKFSNHWFGYH